jgi:hypothetical protein
VVVADEVGEAHAGEMSARAAASATAGTERRMSERLPWDDDRWRVVSGRGGPETRPP